MLLLINDETQRTSIRHLGSKARAKTKMVSIHRRTGGRRLMDALKRDMLVLGATEYRVRQGKSTNRKTEKD